MLIIFYGIPIPIYSLFPKLIPTSTCLILRQSVLSFQRRKLSITVQSFERTKRGPSFGDLELLDPVVNHQLGVTQAKTTPRCQLRPVTIQHRLSHPCSGAWPTDEDFL